MKDKQKFVGLADLAVELALSRSTLRRRLTEDGVRSYRLGPSTVRYRREDVEAWLTDQAEDEDVEEEDEDEEQDDLEEDDDDLDEEEEDDDDDLDFDDDDDDD